MRFVKIMAFLSAFIMLCSCSTQSAEVSSNKSNASKDALSSGTKSSVGSTFSSAQTSEPSSATSGKNSSSKNSSASSIKNSSKQSSADSSKDTSSKYPNKADFNAPAGYEKYSGTRDPFYWPFAATSIWNMPIGSGAILKKAPFVAERVVKTDVEYVIQVKETDPIVELYTPNSFKSRWPGNRLLGTMRVPFDFTLADVEGSHSPNNCATFIQPDGRSLIQLEPCCRVEKGKQIVGHKCKFDIDIYGAGIQGTHYGSGLSAFGGSIRLGELTSDEPIKHALKLNVYAHKYIYFDKSTQKGYVWPADRHDSYANKSDDNRAYGGTMPELRMGSLLTIPKNITAESLGLKTEVAKKIFYALQNYGCYIVDDSATDTYDWSVQSGVAEEVKAKYGFDLRSTRNQNNDYYQDSMKMFQNLYVVTNNSPTSIGGGGTPCKPLAPDFE